MRILLEAEGLEAIYAKVLREELGEIDIQAWPNWESPEEADYAIAWRLPRGVLGRCTKLKGFLSIGAGVDQLVEDPDFPRKTPLVLDPTLNVGMAEYVTMVTLCLHRDFLTYREQQARSEWHQHRQLLPEERTVGMMGLGSLAQSCLDRLQGFGFKLKAWSAIDGPSRAGVPCHYGMAGLPAFLAGLDILIILTPLNRHTKLILDEARLVHLPHGARIANVARGSILSMDAARKALDSGRIDRLWLDVFDTEPLPADHWAWLHPRVVITPHVAAATLPESAARIMAGTIRAFERGETPDGIVDPAIVF